MNIYVKKAMEAMLLDMVYSSFEEKRTGAY